MGDSPKIFKNWKIFQKSSKFGRYFKNLKNLEDFSKIFKIWKIFQKSSKFWRFSKNLRNLEDFPNIFKISKIFQKSSKFSAILPKTVTLICSGGTSRRFTTFFSKTNFGDFGLNLPNIWSILPNIWKNLASQTCLRRLYYVLCDVFYNVFYDVFTKYFTSFTMYFTTFYIVVYDVFTL